MCYFASMNSMFSFNIQEIAIRILVNSVYDLKFVTVALQNILNSLLSSQVN